MKKRFSCKITKQKRPFLFLKKRLFLVLVFLTTLSIGYGQTYPDFSANPRPCNGRFILEIPIWYCNNNGDDSELEKLDVSVDDGNGAATVWSGVFADNDDGLKFNDVERDCWDDGQSVTESFPHGTIKGIASTAKLSKLTETNDSWIMYKLEFGPIPNSWYGKTIKVKVSGSFFDIDDAYSKEDKNLTFPSIPTPTGLQQESGDKFCQKIKLKWTKPNFSSICSDGNFNYELEGKKLPNGNWRRLTTITNKNTINYEHAALNTGDNYEYRMRTKFGSVFSRFSTSSSGTTNSLPKAPINFMASTTNCDQTVDLTWAQDPNDLTPIKEFRIYRNSQLIKITENRFYTDEEVPSRGVSYNYQVRAINECGWGPLVSVEGGSPSDPTPPTNIDTMTVRDEKGIRIKWDPSALVSEYKIERSILGGGSPTLLGPIDKDSTSYLDESVVACQTYEYRVFALNDCKADGVPSATKVNGRLVPNLKNTFTASALRASKGFYSDRIDLSWNVQNNSNFINAFKVYRRELNQDTSILIASLNSGSNIYVDNLVSAGKLYEYTVIAETQCESETVFSNEAKAIGFRSPFGLVAGKVSYSAGTPVENVKITAETTNPIQGTSLQFGGNDAIQISNKLDLNLTNEFLMEAWIQPTAYDADFSVFHKPSIYHLKYLRASHQYEFTVNRTGSPIIETISADNFKVDEFNHIGVELYQDSLTIYRNGEPLKKSKVSNAININDNTSDITLGNGFKGYLTEFRFWTKGKGNILFKRDFLRRMKGNELGLKVYLRMNEGAGNFTYDGSSTNDTFNEHHGRFISAPQWSLEFPTASQLGLVAYTTDKGIYTLDIPYNGNGETFTITPTYPSHEFDPPTKAIFIGDGSPVQNNVDFEDKSSFIVTGRVSFDKTLHGDSEDCFSEGVSINVINKDGFSVIRSIEKTATDGSYSIEVPIGDHYIEVEKAGHLFSISRWPADTTFNFQAPRAGVNFIDSTYRKIIGRVVGGLKEGNKPLGFSKSINNIGKADITFTSENGCKTRTVKTDETTGEYEVFLPPFKYNVTEIELENNFGNALFGQADNSNGIGTSINLAEAKDTLFIRDTIFGVLDDIVQVDSIPYNAIYKVIHRNSPTIKVTGDFPSTPTGDSLLIGEKEITLGQDLTYSLLGIEPGISPIPYPIFLQGQRYTSHIKINEIYHRYDASKNIIATDNSPSIGVLTIQNRLDAQQYANNKVIVQNGVFDYAFRAGAPNLSLAEIEKYNYTFPMELTFESDGVTAVKYTPFPMEPGGNKFYRGYIMGGAITGTDVTIAGPASVDLILRDPPGSNSFATWAKDSVYTTVKSTSLTHNHDFNESAFGQLGLEFGFGLGLAPGPELEFEQSVRNTSSFTEGKYRTEDDVEVTEKTASENISTSAAADPEFVGGQGDIMVGTSSFQTFGKGEFLTSVKTELCSNPEVTCFINEFRPGYSLGFKPGMVFRPDSGLTKYIFTVFEIENVVIPDLEAIRNNIFVSSSNYYTNLVQADDPKFDIRFGSNNDDFNAWGAEVSTDDYFSGQFPDTLGKSYVFYRSKKVAEQGNGIDSIRVYNNQIRLWKLALAKNEKAKYDALTAPTDSAVVDNITIGTAIIEKSYSSTNTKTSTVTKETQFSYENNTELELLINGTGAGGNFSYTYTDVNGYLNDTTNSVTNTFSYHIEDGDAGDLINVQVVDPRDGNGVIFKVTGGQTSCPFLGDQFMHYYDKNRRGNPDELVFASTYIDDKTNTYSPRTVQRDKPTIGVAQASLLNIPADEPAVFTLILGNQSESEDDRTYDLRVDLGSNPDGAILEIDGLDPNRSYDVPYSLGGGVALTKTLTLRRGPSEFDYEDIKVILKSSCDDELADTIRLTAKFVPTCTNAFVQKPQDNWVFNNSFKDTLPTINIQGYNYNFEGFDGMIFQYKLQSASTWLNAAEFFKDTTGIGQEADKYYIDPSTSFSTFDWDISDLDDGNYEFRVQSLCNFPPTYSNIRNGSNPSRGIMDRINPHPFGNPSPADGILSPNDELSIQFNEPIDLGSLAASNFDIRGVINGTETNHSTSLFFDGINDEVEVTGGVALNNRDFTIAFAAKRGTLGGEQTIFSQGSDSKERIFIGFNDANQLVFRIGEQEITSDKIFADQEWRYYAISYNFEQERAELFAIDQSFNGVINTGNTQITKNYKGSGKVLIGKNTVTNSDFFSGNIHELRIWGSARTLAQFSVSSNKLLSGSELGLLYNWRMDEATDNIAMDNVRRRDGTILGPTWTIEPNGHAVNFNGVNDTLRIQAGDVVITEEMDFTLEFWFNSSQATAATLFSNGTGSETALDSLRSWNIDKDVNGQIIVKHNGQEFIAVSDDYFDGTWHHFSLVLQRTGSLSAYIDGNLQNTTQSLTYNTLSGSHFYLGARGFNLDGQTVISNFYEGKLDEFRFWNASRTVEQIRRDKQNRMKGDELGLSLYLPFESFEVTSGGPILTASIEDQITLDTIGSNNRIPHFTEITKWPNFISQTPTIKLQRPIEAIGFTYSVNNDEIIFTPTTSKELIENVTLDITVKGVKDLQGNTMSSPKTWIAYININQVFWEESLREFRKDVEEKLQFTSKIINAGGASKDFTIQNIPEWLTVTPQNGTLAPNSELEIHFEVDPLLNIGNYTQDLLLLTDFRFPEKLTIDLTVREKEPIWELNPADFQNSMGVIGVIEINGIFSTDEEDKIAAFVGDEVRGVNYLQYLPPPIDRYLVFLDLYSNENTGEELTFKVWDASDGIIYTEIDPELIVFDANTQIGSVPVPQVFATSAEITVDIPVQKGWNWINNFLLNPDSTNLDVTLDNLEHTTGDEIKGLFDFSNYSEGNGWQGTLNTSGIRPEQLYKLKIAKEGILKLRGNIIDPSTRPIHLANNWNWIGFISIRNQPIEQAFGNLDAVSGDLVKGRSQFAVYDENLGWLGSLNTLLPGSGYMYQSIGEKTFTFPVAGIDRNSPLSTPTPSLAKWKVNYAAYASNMTIIADWAEICELPVTETNFAIGVFDENDICRGHAIRQDGAKKSLFYLTVGGHSMESLYFKVLNTENGQAYSINQSLDFQSNKHLGSFESPMKLAIPTEVCKVINFDLNPSDNQLTVFPSPFDKSITVEYIGKNTDKNAHLTLYNILGQRVYQQPIAIETGYNNEVINLVKLGLVDGTYLFVLEANGERFSQKVVKH